MQDQFLRRIEYLRISVTDRCNLRCKYCMPSEGIQWIPHDAILSFEEILRLMNISTQLGFRRFRITGGEPLVRKGILEFLQEAAQLPGVEDLMLTTNGLLLPEMAFDLKAAGVHRINVSLDTMDQTRFFENTRGGDVSKVIQGIFRSLEAGLNPVKVNVVVVRGFNTDELPSFLKLAQQYPLHVRFIELMPIGVSSEHRSDFVSIEEMKEILDLKETIPTREIPGGGPAEYFRPGGYKGSIGFISALSRHFCNTCNRVRLTSDGKLRPCLHSKHEIDFRDVLRSGKSDEEILKLFAAAVWHKPAEHHMNQESWQDVRTMSQIGG
ncbi:molybdenum cofactor biosynthesis protein A [Desulfosporosinus orientis DSM 765]|uniref:GTP 3',8-cyclase n=1 Tax=Desulfosporosinus orientis (strain ATCC 19365 / DSM 765 / NCIMB 8382 / VKM B-1628 / Singapore I) TaxID=768706 RepID=G7W5D0_DESOD|nr:GTP 3',8-cyclase MoaA [Desulfosporosinus orientis]AET66358.1 molybdenum cofactor biosynthesis protein A [Desulfosporosinus orientis DSM 765]